MKRGKTIKILFCCILTLLFVASFSPTAFANSAEPPGLTVIVTFPPDDLTLSLHFADGSLTNAVKLEKEQKAWEAYYRLFNGMFDTSPKSSPNSATLVVNSSEKSFECPLPESAFTTYNNLITLDFTNETIVIGQSFARSFLLIIMRVILTLLIEGVIFFAFGYRSKASWVAFIITNLLTQSALNILLSGPNLDSYWIFGYVFYEILIFIVEIKVFAWRLNEHKKSRAIEYALTANMASLVLGGILISYLPI